MPITTTPILRATAAVVVRLLLAAALGLGSDGLRAQEHERPTAAAQEQTGLSAPEIAALRERGLLVVPGGTLADLGRPPRHLFDGYIDARVPTFITTDLLIDGFLAVQSRAMDLVDAIMARDFEALVAAIDRCAVASSSTLLGDLASSLRGVLASAQLDRAKLPSSVQALLPAAVPDVMAIGGGGGRSQLAGYYRARQLLQWCVFHSAAESTAAAALAADPEVAALVRKLVDPLGAVFGGFGASDLVSARLRPGARVLPPIHTPLGQLWDRAGSPSSLLGLLAQDLGRTGSKPTTAGELFAAALAALRTPDDNAPRVHTGEAWRLLHGNTLLAALACHERRASEYADLRLRGIDSGDREARVAPFSAVFRHLAAAATEILAGWRAWEDRAAAANKVECVRIREDLQAFVDCCATVADVARIQAAGGQLNDGQRRTIETIGLTMAQMHGYRGVTWDRANDDHARSVMVGEATDGRWLWVGVARPSILWVYDADDLVSRRGLVFHYCEHAARGAVEPSELPGQAPEAFRSLQLAK
ncbi:MAG: hypothetical protein MUC36_24815 [Planctomycetes bacterium]|nr:hypothetical protein [Planctomycetota bacterium]